MCGWRVYIIFRVVDFKIEASTFSYECMRVYSGGCNKLIIINLIRPEVSVTKSTTEAH